MRGAGFEFFKRPGAKGFVELYELYRPRPAGVPVWMRPSHARIEEMKQDAREVPEASDEHYRLWLSERFYALQGTATGGFIDVGVCA